MATPIDFIVRQGLQVTTNVVVGTYAMANAAPLYGMIVSGNVGVGTYNPVQKLQVLGNIQISNVAGAGSGLYFPDGTYQTTAASGTGASIIVQSTTSSGPYYPIFVSGTGVQTEYISGNNLFSLNPSTNSVGIGTGQPAYTLDVRGTSGPAFFSTLNGRDYQIYVGNNQPVGDAAIVGYSNSNLYAYLSTTAATSPSLVVTNTSNIGIGTTIPTNALDIVGGPVSIGYNQQAGSNDSLAVSGNIGIGVANPSTLSDTPSLGIVPQSNQAGIQINGNATSPGDFLDFYDSYSSIVFSVDSTGTVTSGIWAGAVIDVSVGGTGLTSIPANAILVGYNSTQIQYVTYDSISVQGGTAGLGNVLINGGADSLPQWGAINLASDAAVSGTLSWANGGTNVTTFSNNAIVYSSSSTESNGNQLISLTSPTVAGHANAAVVFSDTGIPSIVTGGPYTYLTPDAGGGALSFAQVSLTQGVSGTLPVGNGGTGGTTWTLYGLLYGNGTSALQQVAVPQAGNVLVSTVSGQPQWTIKGNNANYSLITNGSGSVDFAQVSLTAGVTGVLPYANGGTNANISWTQGSIIYAGASAFAQDNTNFFWDATNHRLGLGTATPTTTLDVNGTATIRNGANIVAGGANIVAGGLTVFGGAGGTGMFQGAVTAASLTSNTSTTTVTLNVTSNAPSSSTASGALQVTGGVGVGGNLYVGGFANFASNVVIQGNLFVEGNTSIINTTTLLVQDPVVEVGTGINGAPLTVDDGKDRGVLMHYYSTGAQYGLPGDNHAYFGRSDEGATLGNLVYITNVQPGTTNVANPYFANSPGWMWGTAQFGNLILSGNANSTSSSTGALVIQNTGGIGVGGNIYVNGVANFTSVIVTGSLTAGSYSTTGSIISGSIQTGPITASTIQANSTVTAQAIVSNATLTVGNAFVANTTATLSSTTGAVVVAGGVGIGGNLYVAGSSWVNNLSITSANTTTSSTTGALVVTGGIASGNNLYVAGSSWTGNLSITNATASTSTTSGALTVAGGVGIQGNMYLGGVMYGVANIALYTQNVAITATSAAGTYYPTFVSATSGNLLLDANASFNYNPSTTLLTAGAFAPTSSTAPTNGIYLPSANTLGFATNSTQQLTISSTGVVTVIEAINSTGTGTGALVVNGGIGVAQNVFVGNSLWAGNASITNAVSTTSSTTGALVVAGGIASGNNLFVANSTWVGNLSIVNTTPTTSGTTGALIVAGGIGVNSNVFVAGNINVTGSGYSTIGNLIITSTASSASSTTGALIVNGGIGVGGNIYASGNIVGAGVNVTIITGNSATFYGNQYGFNALYAGIPAGYSVVPSTVLQTTGNINAYIQNNFQNLNNGNQSSTDWVATANNGTDTINYIDMGIAGSGWDGTQSNSLFNALSPDDGYLYVQGNTNSTFGGNLVIGSGTTNRSLKIVAGGNTAAYIVGVFNTPNTATVSSTTGSFILTGGQAITGNIYVTSSGWFGNVSVTNTTASSTSTTGALVVAGGVGIGGAVNIVGSVTAQTINATAIGNVTPSTGVFTTLQTTGTATVNSLASNSTVSGNSFVVGGNVVTGMSGAGPFTVDSFLTSAYRTAHYLIQITDVTNTRYHSEQIMLIQDGTTVYKSEYNLVYSNQQLGTFDSTISGGVLSLLYTPYLNGPSLSIKLMRSTVPV